MPAVFWAVSARASRLWPASPSNPKVPFLNLGWALMSEVAPVPLVGLTGGVFNFCTQLAGILTPIIIGVLVAQTGSFYGGLAYIAVVALIGALSFIFIVGPVAWIAPPDWA